MLGIFRLSTDIAEHGALHMWSRWLLGVCILLSATMQGMAAEAPFRINTGFTPPVSTIFEQILLEAFSRLGKRIDFREVSAERSLILVDQGIDNAECCRIPEVVQREYFNLVTVPESVFEVRFSAFAINQDVRVEKWDDLKPYAVGTVTGWKILVNNIGLVQPREYFVLENAQAMFRMLDMGRLEVAALGYLSGMKVLHELGLGGVVHAVEPPLATRKLYLMLNRKHVDLVPQLNRILLELKADGTVDRIVQRVVAGT